MLKAFVMETMEGLSREAIAEKLEPEVGRKLNPKTIKRYVDTVRGSIHELVQMQGTEDLAGVAAKSGGEQPYDGEPVDAAELSNIIKSSVKPEPENNRVGNGLVKPSRAPDSNTQIETRDVQPFNFPTSNPIDSLGSMGEIVRFAAVGGTTIGSGVEKIHRGVTDESMSEMERLMNVGEGCAAVGPALLSIAMSFKKLIGTDEKTIREIKDGELK